MIVRVSKYHAINLDHHHSFLWSFYEEDYDGIAEEEDTTGTIQLEVCRGKGGDSSVYEVDQILTKEEFNKVVEAFFNTFYIDVTLFDLPNEVGQIIGGRGHDSKSKQ